MTKETNPYICYMLNSLSIDFSKVKSCVETGSHEGQGAYTFSTFFDDVTSIELSPKLHKRCTETYTDISSITFLQGKSTDLLGEIVESIETPYFLFLDAHGSGGETVFDQDYGMQGSPVLEELDMVKSNTPEWIVIDDLREFDNPNKAYPSRSEIISKVAELGDYSDPIVLYLDDVNHRLHGLPQWYCFEKQ